MDDATSSTMFGLILVRRESLYFKFMVEVVVKLTTYELHLNKKGGYMMLGVLFYLEVQALIFRVFYLLLIELANSA